MNKLYICYIYDIYVPYQHHTFLIYSNQQVPLGSIASIILFYDFLREFKAILNVYLFWTSPWVTIIVTSWLKLNRILLSMLHNLWLLNNSTSRLLWIHLFNNMKYSWPNGILFVWFFGCLWVEKFMIIPPHS